MIPAAAVAAVFLAVIAVKADTATAVLVAVLWGGMLALMAWDPGRLGKPRPPRHRSGDIVTTARTPSPRDADTAVGILADILLTLPGDGDVDMTAGVESTGRRIRGAPSPSSPKRLGTTSS